MQKSELISLINQINKDDIKLKNLSAIILKQETKRNLANQETTKLYRNIGEIELNKLLNGQTIEGGYNLSREPQSTADYKNVICTFTEKIVWNKPNSDYHEYIITLEVPTELITKKGYGIYHASKEFENTKIWTGYRGKTKYEIPEVYLDNYNIGNLVHVQKTKNSNYKNDIVSKLNDLDIEFD